jgi:hypothetical protein
MLRTRHKLLFSFFLIIFTVVACEGLRGPQGVPGQGCIVLESEEFVLIQCGETKATVYNGVDGKDAEIEWVDPCPELYHRFPELLMLIEDEYYAVYSSRTKTHLTKLVDNTTYRTTDGRQCYFTLEDLD